MPTDMTKLTVAFRNFANESKKPTRCGGLITSCWKHLTHDISHKHQFLTRFLTNEAATLVEIRGDTVHRTGQACRKTNRQILA